ncbi:uncharacterized protein LOC110437102 [Sorghum bicolor]|uniref:uncharacterized protein LOC110437102 n=1 Tax=Sorghum bicolor TaxID=4558 RepID=UPI000B425067|nr:uncharacterized protein LOC110437102 [Sorghum bicolor]|eukprot:XP_021321023.1 uncharacterized protein LOC110437102 [Sorghum bicolor]
MVFFFFFWTISFLFCSSLCFGLCHALRREPVRWFGRGGGGLSAFGLGRRLFGYGHSEETRRWQRRRPPDCHGDDTAVVRGLETYAERQQRVHHCLKKEKRVKIAKRRIRKKEASNKLLHRLHRVNALPQFQR